MPLLVCDVWGAFLFRRHRPRVLMRSLLLVDLSYLGFPPFVTTLL